MNLSRRRPSKLEMSICLANRMSFLAWMISLPSASTEHVIRVDRVKGDQSKKIDDAARQPSGLFHSKAYNEAS
jgi:hypothetical protein